MKIPCAALLLALCPSVAAAKCADRLMHIYGKVEEAPGVPAKAVPVGVSWLVRDRASGPALAVTKDDGTFSIHFRFNRFSSSGLLGDRCKSELSHISVAVYRADEQSTAVELAVSRDSDEVDAGVFGPGAAWRLPCGLQRCGD